MEFFTQAVNVLKILVMAVGAGLGVGLFLARNIIEGHGGYIKVKSKVGAGSTFGIYFPILSKVKD